MYYYNDFVPFHFFGFIFMIVFWVLIIWGVVVLFKKASTHHRDGHRALEILKERYAKGEINNHQFEEMKKHITE